MPISPVADSSNAGNALSITALLPLVFRSARVVDQIIDSDIARADARTDALSRQTVSIIACATVVSGRS